MEGEERCRRGDAAGGREREKGGGKREGEREREKEKVRGIMNLEYVESDVYVSEGLAGCQLGLLNIVPGRLTHQSTQMSSWTLKMCTDMHINSNVHFLQ
jgi:hypothetical protein